MAESKHTPGPWRWEANPSGGAFVETAGVAIADVKSRGGVPHPVQAHCEANARLIAAAPDLLASALAEERMSQGFDTEEELRAARLDADRLRRAAIAKAEGSSNG